MSFARLAESLASRRQSRSKASFPWPQTRSRQKVPAQDSSSTGKTRHWHPAREFQLLRQLSQTIDLGLPDKLAVSVDLVKNQTNMMTRNKESQGLKGSRTKLKAIRTLYIIRSEAMWDNWGTLRLNKIIIHLHITYSRFKMQPGVSHKTQLWNVVFPAGKKIWFYSRIFHSQHFSVGAPRGR